MSNASISRYHFSYRLQGLHFLILFTLRPYLAWVLALLSLLLVWVGGWGLGVRVGGWGLGVGSLLCFVSFHFLTSCSVAGKMQVFLPTPPSGGLFAFSGDGLVPSKPKLP